MDDPRQVRCRRPARRLRQVAPRQTLNRRRGGLNTPLDIAAGAPLLLCGSVAAGRGQRFVVGGPLFLRRAFTRLFNAFPGQLFLTGFRRRYLPLRPRDIRRR
ncbi:hypothetical protein [Pantoea sp.]|uniref:hypothetical protein n=1 Tax=Pantoea sp. TaxID=69393 RepID=UPI0028A9FEB1|nr:hypothetical protein [Pantoea sp.]